MPDRRYPLAELAKAMCCTERDALTRLGVAGSTRKLYLERGLVPKAADKLATRAGLHVAVVWPSWFDDVLEDHGRVCRNDRCTSRFLPSRSNQMYCTIPCGRRARTRVWNARRRSDPAVQAAEAAYAAAYRAGARQTLRLKRRLRYEQNRDAELARQRAYDAANRERARARTRASRDRAKEAA
jgi:hypothetical protein